MTTDLTPACISQAYDNLRDAISHLAEAEDRLRDAYLTPDLVEQRIAAEVSRDAADTEHQLARATVEEIDHLLRLMEATNAAAIERLANMNADLLEQLDSAAGIGEAQAQEIEHLAARLSVNQPAAMIGTFGNC